MIESFFYQDLRVTICIFIKNETPAQMRSSEFCKIFQNIFSIEHLGTTSRSSAFTVNFKHIKQLINSSSF